MPPFKNEKTKHTMTINLLKIVPVSIAQLEETCIIICKGPDLNTDTPLFRLEKREILTISLFDQKKYLLNILKFFFYSIKYIEVL